ncbi:CPBP family intramembrane glutamic endopeptidase [Tahibacter amnicola]|uniref:CPBP family intramembrane metalloprotease n=1 Tax=Tahibacter amnicola TaxID=2976241 RepID=A0ABY6BC49_9GAMM|nr:CPBP family intramembrane glutamic endopeptidase [Tahibacter amnicola]UXI67132.1 CPBP family intramembrane metalloprotease [Tahibacter amnicola]
MSRLPLRTRFGSWLLYAFAVLAALLATQWVAHLQVRSYLRDEAARAWFLARSGSTPFQWQFRQRDDLIAGTVFGASRFHVDDSGIHVDGDHTPVEIGLRLSQPLDLRQFDQLTIRTTPDKAARQIIIRETLDAPQVSAMLDVPPTAVGPIDLSALAWRDEDGRPASVPRRADMVRLRLDRSATAMLDIHSVRFAPSAGATRLPAVTEVPHVTSVESALLLRDALRRREPSALVVYAGDIPTESTHAPSPAGAGWRWLLTGLAATGMVLLRLRPPHSPSWRAGLEATALLAGPLAVILGGHLGDNLGAWTTVAIALTVAFALTLRWPAWREWISPSMAAWRGPALAMLVALVVGAWFLAQAPDAHWPTPTQFARYTAWAFVQQFLLCGLVATRLEQAGLSSRATALAVATLFALMHTPNAALMLATFVGGLIWSTAWLRDRNLAGIGLSHAVAATILFATAPTALLRSAEVSARFLL